MKNPYISDLQPDQIATGLFLVSAKDIRQKKSGDPFLSLILTDKTGEIDAKMWDNVVEVMDTFERDSFVRVRGLPQIFQNKLQLTIHKLQSLAEVASEFRWVLKEPLTSLLKAEQPWIDSSLRFGV